MSVKNGSAAVTGVNTGFDATVRVGDSFIGPDGANYEVANVASATVISILPAYKGPTVSGSAYAIMPVQGYPKLMVDLFNQLRLQFGDKMAALGTTGNYDILPVAKGGTGGVNKADALEGLGLTQAALKNAAIMDESFDLIDPATGVKMGSMTYDQACRAFYSIYIGAGKEKAAAELAAQNAVTD